jgi:hypothetical protein
MTMRENTIADTPLYLPRRYGAGKAAQDRPERPDEPGHLNERRRMA